MTQNNPPLPGRPRAGAGTPAATDQTGFDEIPEAPDPVTGTPAATATPSTVAPPATAAPSATNTDLPKQTDGAHMLVEFGPYSAELLKSTTAALVKAASSGSHSSHTSTEKATAKETAAAASAAASAQTNDVISAIAASNAKTADAMTALAAGFTNQNTLFEKLVNADEQKAKAQDAANTKIIDALNVLATKADEQILTGKKILTATDPKTRDVTDTPPTKVEIANQPKRSTIWDILTCIAAIIILLVLLYSIWQKVSAVTPTPAPAPSLSATSGAIPLPPPPPPDPARLDNRIGTICDDKIAANNKILDQNQTRVVDGLRTELKQQIADSSAETRKFVETVEQRWKSEVLKELRKDRKQDPAEMVWYRDLWLYNNEGVLLMKILKVKSTDIVPLDDHIHYVCNNRPQDHFGQYLVTFEYLDGPEIVGKITCTVGSEVKEIIKLTPNHVLHDQASILYDDGHGNLVRPPNGAEYNTLGAY